MRLKYWIKLGLEVFLWSLAACVFFGVIMLIQGSEQDFASLLVSLMSILSGFGGLMLAIFSGTVYKLYLPLTLSMGSTRREAFFGIEVYRLTSIVCFLCLFAVCNHLPPIAARIQADPAGMTLYAPLSILGYYLLSSSMGSLLGIVTLRFGKVGTIIMAIILGLFGGFCGFVMSSGTLLPDFLSSHLGQLRPSWIFLFGLACHLLMTIPETKTINHMVVKL